MKTLPNKYGLSLQPCENNKSNGGLRLLYSTVYLALKQEKPESVLTIFCLVSDYGSDSDSFKYLMVHYNSTTWCMTSKLVDIYFFFFTKWPQSESGSQFYASPEGHHLLQPSLPITRATLVLSLYDPTHHRGLELLIHMTNWESLDVVDIFLNTFLELSVLNYLCFTILYLLIWIIHAIFMWLPIILLFRAWTPVWQSVFCEGRFPPPQCFYSSSPLSFLPLSSSPPSGCLAKLFKCAFSLKYLCCCWMYNRFIFVFRK